MSAQFMIRRAVADDAPTLAEMVGELLTEIMAATNTKAFNFELNQTVQRLIDFIRHEKYFVFIAHTHNDTPAGFIALYECHALYAEGAFGTIPELYVRPACRSQQLGRCLLAEAKAFGALRGWSRLEVTTPPLPAFDKTLAFYEREGFSITGGRKLKVAL